MPRFLVLLSWILSSMAGWVDLAKQCVLNSPFTLSFPIFYLSIHLWNGMVDFFRAQEVVPHPGEIDAFQSGRTPVPFKGKRTSTTTTLFRDKRCCFQAIHSRLSNLKLGWEKYEHWLEFNPLWELKKIVIFSSNQGSRRTQ